MKGLIRAEYYMIRAEIGVYLKMLAFFTAFSLFIKSYLYVMTMQFVISVLLLLSMMAVDENGKDAYYQQLPFSRRELVKEKYMRGCVFLIPFMLGADVVGFIITLIYRLDMVEFFGEMTIGMVYLFLAIDIAIPIAIRRGAGRSRLLCIICVFVPCFLLVYPISVFLKGRPGINVEFVVLIMMLAVLALAVLLLPLSYKLSVKFYQAKEF